MGNSGGLRSKRAMCVWTIAGAGLLMLFMSPAVLAETPVFTPEMGPQAPAAPVTPKALHYTDDAGVKRTSVLVHMEPALLKRAPQRADVRTAAVEAGGKVKYEYDVALPSVLNLRDIPESQLAALERMPGVVKVEIDKYHEQVVRLHDSTPLIRGLQSQVTGAGYSADGAGVRVAIVDTGIDSDHLMYTDRIDTAAGHDFYNDDSNPEDDNGHGSHVAGIAVGGLGLSWDPCGTGSIPIQGVAPAATLIGVKILNSGGGGFDSDIIAGINYAADQSPSGGRADVMNLSIGQLNFSGTCDSDSWAVAANNAAAAGVIVIAASGNENNSNSMGTPACGSNVFSVGGTWKADYPTCEDNTTVWSWGICVDNAPVTDEVGCFSNESDLLDVSAPGLNIWSASNSAGGSSITGKSGTSMACPHVVGLAALILGEDPGLTRTEVLQIIIDGAVDLGPAGHDRGYGWGRIDVLNSLALVTPCQTDPDCDDGLWCNGAETCNGGCQAGTDPCPGEDCDEVNDVCVPLVCNDDGTCDAGEDCNNCSNDCFSGSGAVCGNGICEAGDGEDCVSCGADCNGKTGGKPSSRFCCGDGDGPNPLSCGDSACSSGGWSCTDTPAAGSCCGDGTCEGSEDGNNCAIDCACQSAADCDDAVACTDDACVGGFCENTANDGNCPDDGQFCNGSEYCDAGADCSSTGDPCASNENCDEANDTCVACTGKNGSCSAGSECCSGTCKANGRCR